MKLILVTGANGQLGKSIHRNSSNYPELKIVFTDVEELDITKTEEVNAFFENHAFDYCINCAAYTAVDKAEEEVDKAFLINAKAALQRDALMRSRVPLSRSWWPCSDAAKLSTRLHSISSFDIDVLATK